MRSSFLSDWLACHCEERNDEAILFYNRPPDEIARWLERIFDENLFPRNGMIAWCHGCAEGSSVLGRVQRLVDCIKFPCRPLYIRLRGKTRQARMSPRAEHIRGTN